MYGVNNISSSDAISRDMNSLLFSSTFKHPADTEFAKIKQLISQDPFSEFENNQNQDQDQTQQYENHGQGTLQSYRSTPSSFFSNLLNEVNEYSDPVTGSSDNEADERFMEKSNAPRDFLRYESSNMKQETKESVNQNHNNKNGYGYGYVNQFNLDSNNSNLTRQTSSPAGFLSSLTAENGMKDVSKGSSSSSLNNHINFSLGSPSSSKFLPQIDENNSEFHESPFSSLKRSRDGAVKMSQNGDTGNHRVNLVHHMSLPKTSSEMAVLHFQQETLVPWKTRAKRGFATHPRSIAERVRRTRISERIKRLQELFPDMDKQTNTADMLDMAVDYIKDLQKELQILNDARARCKCSSKQLQSGQTM